MKKLLKIFTITIGALFATFFVYANWAPPTAGERIYMNDPTGLTTLKIPIDHTEAEIRAVTIELNNAKGVTSFTHAANLNMLAVTYSKSKTAENDIIAHLQTKGYRITKKYIETNQPQCPVHGYLDAFYKAKYALNIRK